MIDVKSFVDYLQHKDINFFTGVPDSLLKDLCGYITDTLDKKNHIISTNEGSSLGLAIGYHLATEKIPVVYMQNSGLGNIINPLLSLADKKVYSIPIFLIIGWRGEPGIKDEPQHVKQGEITLGLLDEMGVDYEILRSDSDFKLKVDKLINNISRNKKVSALIIPKNTFNKFKFKSDTSKNFSITREDAIDLIVKSSNKSDVFVSTTGKTSRELFELRRLYNLNHSSDFLTVGGMGHANQIALGIAISRPDLNVYCIDGDGAILMHMGGSGLIGQISPKNLKHIIINNGSHDSVGGQPTFAFDIDFLKIFKAFKYVSVDRSSTLIDLKKKIIELKNNDGPSMLEICVKKGARSDLGRPTTTPLENKINFMNFLKKQ